jgi:hypothetical protein
MPFMVDHAAFESAPFYSIHPRLPDLARAVSLEPFLGTVFLANLFSRQLMQ